MISSSGSVLIPMNSDSGNSITWGLILISSALWDSGISINWIWWSTCWPSDSRFTLLASDWVSMEWNSSSSIASWFSSLESITTDSIKVFTASTPTCFCPSFSKFSAMFVLIGLASSLWSAGRLDSLWITSGIAPDVGTNFSTTGLSTSLITFWPFDPVRPDVPEGPWSP